MDKEDDVAPVLSFCIFFRELVDCKQKFAEWISR